MNPGPLHIGLVHPFAWPEVRRGGERYLDDLASHLIRHGHRVEVITGTDATPSVDESDGLVVRRIRHVSSRRLQRRGFSKGDLFAWRALRALRGRRFDVVHALMPTAALAARLARQRTVFTVLGHPTPDQFGMRPFDVRLFRAALRRSSAAVALSRASAAATREHLGAAVGVLPPGVRLDRFPLEASARTGPARILYSADASDPRKRADLVFAAMPHVLEALPDARLQLSSPGDPSAALAELGEHRQGVEEVIDDLGTGTLDDVPGRYRAASVTVLPSRHEAFGLALVEALASGTPVVCTDDGGMPEIVDDPAIGRVVAPGDPRALAHAIVEVVALAAEAGTPERCRDHARRFGWDEAVGPMHEKLYREVAAR